MDFKQVGTLGTPIIIAAKNQLPELNGSYKGIFFKTTYDPSSEEDYPKGTILTVVENSDGTFSWSKSTILERLTNGITDGSQLLKNIEAFDGKGNKIVGTLESGSGTGDIKNPYKARTYSEMNNYRTKNYANAYVEYTGQRQFTRNQIQDSSMYDKLYFDFPKQIGWVETFDWDNPDSNWTSDGLLYKCIVLFNVTPTKISDNTTEDAIPFSVYQMTTTGDSSDAQAGTVMYGIGFPSSFSWVSWGGTPDKEYSRTGYKLKITNVKREYYYLISDIISTTGEWSQIIDGTQFGYKHGTYKIDTNSNTIDNFQKLNLVLEDGGGGTARKTITNDYSYNLNSYYDYILKYSYEGKSSSVICKVGNFKFEGTQVTGANQLYNVTSDSDPDGIFFSLDPSCPLPYGWNAASIVDNFDLSNPKQSTPNKSVVGVSSNLYTLVGKTVTIEDISTAADMIYYTTLPSLSTPAAAADIIKGKQAIDAEGNRISGTLEPTVLPTLTNEGTTADLVTGKQLISSSGEIVTGSYEGIILPTLTNEGTAADLAKGKQLISNSGEIVTGTATIANEVGTGDFWVKVIDYDGTVLLEKRGNNGDSFDLPPAPSHEGLVFQEWSASCPITDGKVVIDNNNIMAGAVYTTASGLNEFDIELTEDFGLSVSLEIDGEKDWGDGTTDSETTHTYAAYGNYTIKSKEKNNLSLMEGFCLMPCTFIKLTSIAYIDRNAFRGCESLSNITIPKGVTFQFGSFNGCTGLTNIIIPEGETDIWYDFFANCCRLTNVVIPNGITKIYNNAFNGCCSLIKVVIPNGVTEIEGDVFSTCSSLTDIVIPNTVLKIGASVFRYCYNLKNITIPDNLTNIYGSTFQNCYELTNIVISNNVTDIGSYAFNNCYSLKNITVSDNITGIHEATFFNCLSLMKITIPDKVTNIESYAFDGCCNLKNIIIPNNVTNIGAYAFAGCTRLTSIIIPDKVTNIEAGAFTECSGLMDVTIGSGVTNIGSDAFNCSNLKTVFYAGTKEQWETISIGSGNSSLTRAIVYDYDGVERTYSFVSNCDQSVDSITATYLTSLPTLVRDGYHLYGWYDNETFEGKAVSAPYCSKDKTTLYAKWLTQEEWDALRDGTSFEKAYIAESGQTYDVNITKGGQIVYFEFTPTTSGSFIIQSTGSVDTRGTLYNSTQSSLAENDDDGDGSNFKITYTMEAGTTYYVAAKIFSSSATGTFQVSFS